MAIPIWNKKTGEVWVADFDLAMIKGLGGLPDASDADNPCYAVNIPGASSTKVPIYFNQPEQIYKNRKAPSIIIMRDDLSPALNRWMGVGQLEYRAGVSGTEILINGVSGYTQFVSKPQAMPYDFIYTIVCFDRYERTVQPILKQVLKSFPPIGKLYVTDSLGLLRSYEAKSEGPIPNTKELVDAVNRFVSYTVTVRVEGEIDLTTPTETSGVTGFNLQLHRMK